MSAQTSGIPAVDQVVHVLEWLLPVPVVFALRVLSRYEWVRALVLRKVG